MHMTSNFFCVSTPPKVCYSSSPAGWRGPPGLWQSEPYSGRLELQKRDGASWNNFQINVHCLSFLHVLHAEHKSFFVVFFLMYIARYNFSSKHKPVDFLPRLLFSVFSKLFAVFSIVVSQPSSVVKSCNDLLRPVTAWRKNYSYQFGLCAWAVGNFLRRGASVAIEHYCLCRVAYAGAYVVPCTFPGVNEGRRTCLSLTAQLGSTLWLWIITF